MAVAESSTGAGGSPKVGDPATLSPTRFTCSLIYLDSPRYAAVHVASSRQPV
jgi:hypothetical protein